MKIKVTIFFVICVTSILSIYRVQAITLVYNMRVRRSFTYGDETASKKRKPRVVATAVPIIYTRDRTIIDTDLGINISEKRINGGALFNIRYIPSRSWWFEVTTGLEKEHVTSKGSESFSASRVGFDDIVLSGGYDFFPTKNSQIVIYGLTGFPTRTKVTLLEKQDTLVGTRFFSAGIGSEFSYSFINTLKKAFILVFQNRFLHFFNRKFTPILPADAKIQPGNVTDLFFAIRYRYTWNIFETGYNPTFFTNQAVLLSGRTITSKSFVRNSCYASYAHIFEKCPFIKNPIIVGAGLSIAGSKKFDTKAFSCWLNMSVIF